MSDTNSVIIESGHRIEEPLDEQMKALSVQSQTSLQGYNDGHRHALNMANLDYVRQRTNGVSKRLNSMMKKEEEEEENTTSETDTVISSGDIFQLIGHDQTWAKEKSRVPSLVPYRSDAGVEKLRLASDVHRSDLWKPARYTGADIDGTSKFNAGQHDTESDILKRKLVQYRAKVKALTEVLKQMNLNNKENGDTREQTVYESDSDAETLEVVRKQNQELNESLENKNKELIKLKEDLVRNKIEYESMLEEVNDYLQHSDTIADDVNDILKLLLNNMQLTEDERKNLTKAIGFESTFIDVKIKALTVSVNKLIREVDERGISNISIPKSPECSIADVSNVEHSQMESSEVLDSKLEFAIETMHEKYHDFIESIQHKLEKNVDLEAMLKDKIQQQTSLLQAISNTEKERANSRLNSMYLQQSSSELFPDIDDLSKRASMELSRSYQDYVNTLDGMIKNYKGELEDKDKQLSELRTHVQSECNSNTEQELASRVKEQRKTLEENLSQWNKERLEYQRQVDKLKNDKKALVSEINSLKEQMKASSLEFEEEVTDLRKRLNVASRKSMYYIDDNQLLQEQLQELGNEYSILNESNVKLREHLEKLSTAEKGAQQLETLKSKVLNHLRFIFQTFEKILQRESIEPAFAKLTHLNQLDSSKHFKKTVVKLDSVFFYIETAIESIVTEHVDLLLNHKEAWPQKSYDDDLQKQSNLKIEELRKKWIGERERRKLESDAATSRINALQIENQKLREQLGL